MQGINRRVFEHRLRQLIAVTVERQGTAEISFDTGFWNNEEGYKRKVQKKAYESLHFDRETKKQSKMI